MGNVAINEQHLHDIGDALRGKLGDTFAGVKNPLEEVIAKTDNYSDDGVLDSTVECGRTTGEFITGWYFKFEGATRITVELKLYWKGDFRIYNSFSMDHDYQVFYASNDKAYAQTLNFDSDSMAIEWVYRGSGTDYGYWLKIRAYDADGNVVKGGYYSTIWPNKFKPRDMAEAIEGMKTIPEKAFALSGKCNHKFAGGSWDWFLNSYGNLITTNAITSAEYMFSGSTVTSIPFTLNISGDNMMNMFSSCERLESAPHINLSLASTTRCNMGSFFHGCQRLRDAEDAFDGSQLASELVKFKTTGEYGSHQLGNLFHGCYSLRKTPSWLAYIELNQESTSYPAYSYHPYYNIFQACYALDEIVDFPVITLPNKKPTTNYFYYSFQNCFRIKNFIFKTDSNKAPIAANWVNQVIDLSLQVGYGTYNNSLIVGYNSGITMDDIVNTVSDYAVKKDSENWFTPQLSLSRYNHTSAVNTINSLPDTSAAGGTNTIKFRGDSGSLTDGGAINTLTDAEIAVAAAKGWTVTLV